MTIELILLLSMFMFIVLGSFANKDTGLEAAFKKSAPRLGARIEKHIETGAGFGESWEDPQQMPRGDIPRGH